MEQGSEIVNGDVRYHGPLSAADVADTLAGPDGDDAHFDAYPSVFTDYVVPQLVRWRRQRIASALVTLVGVDGSSPRRIGSQLAVTVGGDSLGYISGGCAEKSIIAETIDAIQQRKPRTVRYGRGSKYLDVVLPCGSGIDVHIDPLIATSTLEEIEQKVRNREPADLEIDLKSAVRIAADRTDDGPMAALTPKYVKRYWPAPRLLVAGRGVHVDFIVRMAHELGWQIVVATPDEAVISRTAPFVESSQHLTRPDDFDPSVIDAHTAVVLLFHDHDWEPGIFAKCLGAKAFYFGAMGSRRTHERRKSILRTLGIPESFITSIRGPAGLDLKATTPPEIALSILSEVLANAPGG